MSTFVRRLLVACAAVALLLGVIVAASWGIRRKGVRDVEARERVALYETDHAALAGALRELWERGGHSPHGVRHDARDATMPLALRSLDARDVLVWPGGVNVEMGGQWCHFGFDAFFPGQPPDPDRTVWKDAYPSKEVAPGLWYYAENGLIEP